MDSVYTLLTYIFNITLIGSVFMFCFKCLEFKKNSEAKNYIQSLQAKLSMMRINLKAKVKRKSNKYRSLFPVPIATGDLVDLALLEMIENNLETGQEIQRYFDSAKRINNLLATERFKTKEKEKEKEKEKVPEKIVTQHKSDPNSESTIGREDFMGTDFKSEISIIRTLKDMVEVTALLNKKIEAFNELNIKTPIPNVTPLNFHSLTEMNRVFFSEKNSREEDSSEAA